MGILGRKKNEAEETNGDENGDIYNPVATDVLPSVNEKFAEQVEEPDKRTRNRGSRSSRVIEEASAPEPEPMKTDWPSPVKPSMSLPSRTVVEISLRDSANVKMKKVFIIAGSALLASSLTVGGLSFYSSAQLTSAQNEGENLANSVEKLQPIADYFDGYIARKGAVGKVLAGDMNYTKLQGNLFNAASQHGVKILTETTVAGQPCASSAPFVTPQGIGCITLTVEAPDSGSIANFTGELVADKGFSDPYMTAISSSDKATSTVLVSYTSILLSDRYKTFVGKEDSSAITDLLGQKPTPPTGESGDSSTSGGN